MMSNRHSMKLKHSWEEKRLSLRIPQDNVLVEFAIVSGLLGFLRARRPRYRAFMQDKSVNGMRIVTYQSLNRGTVLKLWLNIFQDDYGVYKTINLQGNVVWSAVDNEKVCTAGIKLHDKPENEMKMWMENVAENMRRLGI